ncbi:MAG: ribonuclease P protein component [Verrucomicrobiota bacterium]
MSPIHGRFPKSAHLRKSGEFAQLRDEGKSFHGRLFVLSVLALPSVGELGEAKIGLITSRRVGGAVVRNRVRRRLREIVREALPHLKRGIWLALIARKSASEASYEAIRSEWVYLAKRGAILC